MMATIPQQQPHPILGGLGLLTTVAQLPPKYRNRYLNFKMTKVEIPLDLSVVKQDMAPITPPPSPSAKRKYVDDMSSSSSSASDENNDSSSNCGGEFEPPQKKIIKAEIKWTLTTPAKPIKVESAPKTTKTHPNTPKAGKNKATRKLKFDEDTSSPVSGTIIRPLEEVNDATMQYSNGDIDPKYNIVEVTEEAKAELAAIKNVIGDYVCKLCRLKFDDAFELARHRCSCIVLLEYRCPECGKRFNCPANLASHRRWHKPKKENVKKANDGADGQDQQFPCTECGKMFKRQAYLRKHMATHKNVKPPAISPSATQLTPMTAEDMSSRGSSHSYGYDMDSMSERSSSPGQLRIVEHTITEEESIAASALTNLRHCTSVIQHTTVAGMAH